MATFLERLLEYYSLTISDYHKLTQDIKSINLPSFDSFNDIEKIKNYFLDAFKNNKRIMIYGDYDCDGVMSTSIISIIFNRYNANYDFYIPFRDKDGYGLNKTKIDEFKKDGYDIILCVDNGISLHDEVNYANSLGLEVVIFDHHSFNKNNLSKAKYILHPVVSNFQKDDINVSAGMVCFYFSWCLLGHIDQYLLSLAAISTISDMMPLLSYNRDIVRLGLFYINNNRYINILNLVDNVMEVNEESISLKLAPKINSIGRLILDNKNKDVVKYFINIEDDQNIHRLSWINSTNEKRKNLVNDFKFEEKKIEDKPGIIIFDETIDEGICGLLANKLMTSYNKPCLILTSSKDEPKILKGSIRTSNGFNVIDFYNVSNEYLLAHGGHEFAGGLSLNIDNLDKLSKIFYEYSLEHKFIKKELKTIEILESEINSENYNILSSFSPFGQNFNEPKFKLNNFPVRHFFTSKDKKHLLHFNNSNNSSISYFNYNHDILDKNLANLIGKLKINFYNNKTTYQFIVETFE